MPPLRRPLRLPDLGVVQVTVLGWRTQRAGNKLRPADLPREERYELRVGVHQNGTSQTSYLSPKSEAVITNKPFPSEVR